MSDPTTTPQEEPTAETTDTQPDNPPADPPATSSDTAANAIDLSNQAELGPRAGAFLIDCVVSFGLVMVLSSTIGRVSSILDLIVSLAGIAYILTRDSLPFLDGQSIGKKALKLRAVTEEGKPLTGNWNPGILRNILFIVPIMAVVEFIILCVKQNDPGGMLRLGDQIAKTKVVKAP